MVVALAAAGITVCFYSVVERFNQPVILFDALGLGLFAVTGAEKVLSFGHNAEVAIILGVTTAVGGGVLRDVLLARVPVILQKEIYALAALIGAAIVVIGNRLQWISSDWISLIGLTVGFSLRLLALHYHWNLPGASDDKHK